MATYLVTGGAGFIGAHVCSELLKKGYKVICLDNLITGNKKNIEELESNPLFSYLEHDIIKSSPIIDEELTGIFHLASPASPNKKSQTSYINFPIETLLVNSQGTFNLLNLAKEKNARFLFASTSEVYGNPLVSPQPETYFGNVNPNGIRSVYDEGKRFGEAMCMAFFRKFGLDVRIMRIFNTYGDKMQKSDGRVVSDFINQALEGKPITVFGEGAQTRSFCFIDDLVGGIISFMEKPDIAGEVINLGNPVEYKIIDLAKLVKELTGSNSEIVFEPLPEDDPLQRRPDITKAKNLLGFEPKVLLEDGLRKTIEYFKSI